MPIEQGIKKVMVIGSGPIVIGQAAEFDYAGTQACKSLQEEGIEVVLVNSNPATIMTDDNIADKVYIQPLTFESLKYIIEKERPDGLLPTLGGQTGLNLAVELSESGVLSKYCVKLLGTKLKAIQQAEDREAFKELMVKIGEPVPRSGIVTSVEEGIQLAEEIGFPIIIRPAYTMGGLGGGIAYDEISLKDVLHTGLHHSRIHQVLMEQSVAGWKEIEFEVMRDKKDTCIIICDMENVDPVGIHTGDSIVVAPSQTLNPEELSMLRDASIKIIRALEIEGGCNVQLALHPTHQEYIVIEVNPRVSRSSALASKAAGYPIAKVASKIAVGLNLEEIPCAITPKTKTVFEPKLDYVVVKIPKWPFDKFSYANRQLGTQMKATGEVMAIDRSFESALLKGIISLEGKETGLRKEKMTAWNNQKIVEQLMEPEDERIFVLAEALRRGWTVDTIYEKTCINPWFLEKIKTIVSMERRLEKEEMTGALLYEAEKMGFTDIEIIELSKTHGEIIDVLRRAHGLYPVYKMVNTCEEGLNLTTPYFYSAYDKEDENTIHHQEKIIVIGSGPIRIGQGIEFDYCSVHAVWAIQKHGSEAIIINNNPETVSTDFDISDKLYFDPLFIEDVYNVIRKEMPKGVIVQFGGQTAINLASKLVERGVQILGTSVDAIDIAENRKRFERLLGELGIPQPKGATATTIEEALEVGKTVSYPVFVRPSYVIGGRGMTIVYNEDELIEYIQEAVEISPDHPLLIDEYIQGKEVEVDGICDGEEILIPGIMEHIERTGVHSGDSICVYPPQTLSEEVIKKLIVYTKKIAIALQVSGLVNIQFAVLDDKVYVIEVNPRASRTVPILSKVTHVPMVQIAMDVILGKKLKELGYGYGLLPEKEFVAVKVPVFSFVKLQEVDPALTPEMKSTGEVLGVDTTYRKALVKGFIGAGYTFPEPGNVLMSIADIDKEEAVYLAQEFIDRGFNIIATKGTAQYFKASGIKVKLIQAHRIEFIQEEMKQQKITLVMNTATKGKDKMRHGFQMRNLAEHYSIPCFTCFDTAIAYMHAWDERMNGERMEYNSLPY